MIHLGDITKISGYAAPIVDCVIGGSPCQDLSAAGKRAGLDGEQSGLFMEQLRIIKEMREHDHRNGRAGVNIRPRYMVWENVPGAFSSNKGEDFRIVLEETAKVADKDASIPMPGKWSTSGCILGNGWSIAWRVLDAQFYGVPQRRRRIALVADFGGHSAPEILFVRKSLSRDTDESQPKGQTITGDVTNSTGAYDCFSIENHPSDSRVDIDESGKVQTLTSRMGTGGGNVPMVMECYSKSKRAQSTTDFETWKRSGVSNTINTFDQGDTRATDAIVHAMQAIGKYKQSEVGSSLKRRDYKDATDLVCAAVDCRNFSENPNINGTLQAKSTVGSSLNLNNVVRTNYIVRRLTPLECERLQGFPDGWTDIGEYIDSNGKKKQSSDAARYKALGNSIAIPPWKWVLKRLCACYERDATMASLFDGIGGFPYIWEQLNGKGSCLWASEIEEFPMAVTKVRFGGDSIG